MPTAEGTSLLSRLGADPVDSAKPPKPYRMRITSGGSISSYVTFALQFLRVNPGTPLVLHTLPPSDPSPSTSTTTTPTPAPRRPTTLFPCTLTTPRLISVTELIKRSYLEELRQGKAKGKGKSGGVWQYTECGVWGGAGGGEEGGVGAGDLARVLSGRKNPKMTHHPYLEITLSTRPLEGMDRRGVTCQSVVVKRKARGKGKGKGKGAAEDEAGDKDGQAKGTGDEMDVDESTAAPVKAVAEAKQAKGGEKRKSEGDDRIPKKRKTDKKA
ncbi:hypothetical protein IAT38_004313 [Cryptococcus sp. DSM 104549]